MKYINITKHNAQQAADALGISEYIKAERRSYYESNCPLLNSAMGYGEICREKCSLYGKAFGRDGTNAGTDICPMYRISNTLNGESGYYLLMREDMLCPQECEDI